MLVCGPQTVCVCVCGQKELGVNLSVLAYPHITFISASCNMPVYKHTHTHTLSLSEDRKSTGLKVELKSVTSLTLGVDCRLFT